MYFADAAFDLAIVEENRLACPRCRKDFPEGAGDVREIAMERMGLLVLLSQNQYIARVKANGFLYEGKTADALRFGAEGPVAISLPPRRSDNSARLRT